MGTPQEITQTILNELKDSPKGYDNTKLIEAILDKWEIEIRLDQCEKDRKMAMNTLHRICDKFGLNNTQENV